MKLLFAALLIGTCCVAQEKMPVKLAAQYRYKIPGLVKFGEFYTDETQTFQSLLLGKDNNNQLHVYYCSYQNPYNLIKFNLTRMLSRTGPDVNYIGQFENSKDEYEMQLQHSTNTIQLTKVSGNLNQGYSATFKLKYEN